VIKLRRSTVDEFLKQLDISDERANEIAESDIQRLAENPEVKEAALEFSTHVIRHALVVSDPVTLMLLLKVMSSVFCMGYQMAERQAEIDELEELHR